MNSQKPSQKPPVRRSLSPPTIVQTMQTEAAAIMQKLFGLNRNWYKSRDIAKNNYELGKKHFHAGNVSDAVMRLKMTVWMEPEHADAWYYLGRSLLAEGKKAEAANAIKKALNLKPGNEEAEYILALALGKNLPPEKAPKRIPQSLTLEHFEAIAPGFNKQQVEVFNYQGHNLLCNAIRAAMVQGRIDHVALELGVGTGLCGSRLRDVSSHITGIDFSAAMLAQAVPLQDAQGRKLYDALINREVRAFLKDAQPESYDIIYSAGLFNYVGDLSEIFALSARALKPGGLFAFTADTMDGDGYRLDTQAGYFRFSLSYLRSLASNNSLTEVKCEKANIYPEDPALVCVFRK